MARNEPRPAPAAYDPLTIGWEKAVLGTGLFDPQTMEEAADLLPSDFTGCHQVIFAEMMALHRRGALDLRAVVEGLRSRGELVRLRAFGASTSEAVAEGEGETYLSELLASRGASMQEYADHVVDASLKRQLRQMAALTAAEAMDQRITASEAQDHAEQRLLSLRRSRSGELGVSIGEILGVFMDRVEGFLAGTLTPAWVPKIDAIRRKMSFIDSEDFVICAARPGEGKSSIMRFDFCQGALSNPPEPTLIFNLENTQTEYAKFLISMVTGIDSEKLKTPRRLSETELASVRATAEALSRLPIFIKTLGAPSVEEIDRITRQHIVRHGIKRVGVDYIQLMNNGLQNTVEDVTRSSKGLRAMALRYGIPVMANSQMSRNIEHRGDDAEPKLSDLRNSGSLEQDGTVVWAPRALWPNPTPAQLRTFPQNIDPETGQLYNNVKAIPVRIHVLKNRNGATGLTEPVLWVKSTNQYIPLEFRNGDNP